MFKLNIGCADLPLGDDWTNVDISTSPHVKADIIADGTNLSQYFEDETVDQIYAGHFIEHLYPDEAIQAVLHWTHLLKEGGSLCVVTPDAKKIFNEYLTGKMTLKELNDKYIYSYIQESYHRYLYDVKSLTKLLTNFGLKNPKVIDNLYDNRLAFPCELQFGVEVWKL